MLVCSHLLGLFPRPQDDGEQIKPPHPLPWYPNNYAWHMNFSRAQLRKVRAPRTKGLICRTEGQAHEL